MSCAARVRCGHEDRSAPPARQLGAPAGTGRAGLRIGLLGGSFNPAHEGHLHVSEVALKRLGLDYVWWLVTPQNPLKPVAGMAPLHGSGPRARNWSRAIRASS